MSEVSTIDTKDGKWQFVVKSEFLKKCSNPAELSCRDLLTIHKINQFFHNPSGPAIVRKKDNMIEYWMDGLKLSEEEGKRIAHNFQFNNKLMDVVSSATSETSPLKSEANETPTK